MQSVQGSGRGLRTPPACLCPGSAYTCLEAATGRALLRQHMDNTGEDHPLNKLRVVIEPGLWGVPVLPQPAGGSGGKRGVVGRGGSPAAGVFHGLQ